MVPSFAFFKKLCRNPQHEVRMPTLKSGSLIQLPCSSIQVHPLPQKIIVRVHDRLRRTPGVRWAACRLMHERLAGLRVDKM